MFEAQEQHKAGKLKFYNDVDELFKDLEINIGNE